MRADAYKARSSRWTTPPLRGRPSSIRSGTYVLAPGRCGMSDQSVID
jgi:hypothetical protein